MDPRSLTAAQWIRTDWVRLHGLRAPAVRLNSVGQQIHDRAGRTAHPHQIVHYQPIVFMKDHNLAQLAYNEGQRIFRENEANTRTTKKQRLKL